jgi:hypothetical protein
MSSVLAWKAGLSLIPGRLPRTRIHPLLERQGLSARSPVKDPAPARGLGNQNAEQGAMIGEPAAERWANETRESIDHSEQALPPDTNLRSKRHF